MTVAGSSETKVGCGNWKPKHGVGPYCANCGFHESEHRETHPYTRAYATPGATLTGEDSVRQADESSRPRELLPSNTKLTPYDMGPWGEWYQRKEVDAEIERLQSALKSVYKLAGGHPIECECRQCEIFELLEPIVGNASPRPAPETYEVYDKIGVLRPDGEFTTYEGCEGDPVYIRRTLKAAVQHGVPMRLYDAISKEVGDIKAERVCELIEGAAFPVHPDRTGKTREPPHCPSCSCGIAGALIPATLS